MGGESGIGHLTRFFSFFMYSKDPDYPRQEEDLQMKILLLALRHDLLSQILPNSRRRACKSCWKLRNVGALMSYYWKKSRKKGESHESNHITSQASITLCLIAQRGTGLKA